MASTSDTARSKYSETQIFVISAAELHRVGSPADAVAGASPQAVAHPQTNEVVARGAFQIVEHEYVQTSIATHPPPKSRIVAAVGDFSWALASDDATSKCRALRLGELTFAFEQRDDAGQVSQLVLLFPSSTSPESIGTLEAILETVCVYAEAEASIQSQEVAQAEFAAAQALQEQLPEIYSSRTAQNIAWAANKAATGISAGAVWASGSLHSASMKLTQGTEPTQQPAKLPPGMSSTLRATASAAKWTAKGLHKVGDGIAWAGGKVAGGALRATGLGGPVDASGGSSNMHQSTHAAAVGAAQVWMALEKAGYLVVTSARDDASKVAAHKYGQDAGEAAHHGMNAAVYTVEAVGALSPRAMARRAAKGTAKQALQRAGQLKAAK